MLKFQMTAHAAKDRADRLLRISRLVGFGEEIVMQAPSPRIGDGSIWKMSETGVMYVTGEDEKFLVTAFIPSENEVHILAEQAKTSIPAYLLAKVRKNLKIRRLVNEGV